MVVFGCGWNLLGHVWISWNKDFGIQICIGEGTFIRDRSGVVPINYKLKEN